MFKFLKGAILFAPFFLFLPLTSQAFTTHLFCECVYTYPEDPAGPIELCPVDADVDVYVDADIGFFQLEKTMPGIQSVLPMKPLLWRRLPKRVILPKELPPLLIDLMENYLFVMMGTLKDMAIVSFQICITVA
jgi:hypothetical protein